jgi:predicted transcriptional regulator
MKLHESINRSYIARELGVSKQFIWKVENGLAKMPSEKQKKLNEVLREISKQLQI